MVSRSHIVEVKKSGEIGIVGQWYMANRVRITKTAARKALEEADGVVKVAAERLGVSSSTMYNYLRRFNLWSTVQVERDGLVQLAKQGLAHHLSKDEPEPWAIKYTLSTMSNEFGGGGVKMQLYATVSPDDWDDDDDA